MLAGLMVNICETGAAGCQVVLSPGWVAVIVQLPAPMMCTVEPSKVTVQSPLAENEMARPEVADAETLKSASPYVLSGSAPKVMVCSLRTTVRLKLPVMLLFAMDVAVRLTGFGAESSVRATAARFPKLSIVAFVLSALIQVTSGAANPSVLALALSEPPDAIYSREPIETG